MTSTYREQPQIVLINGAQVEGLIGEEPLFVKDVVFEALRVHFKGNLAQPIKQYLQRCENAHPADRIISMPVYIDGAEPLAGLKWIGSHPQNPQKGLDRANALITLNDPATNAPFAILSGSLISSMRTMAMSLIAIDRFIENPKTVALLGMGKLGRLHAKFLPRLYGSVETIFCFSNNAQFDDILSPIVKKCETYQEAVNNAEVVITTTSVANPYITFSDLSCGDQLMINLSLMDFDLSVYVNSDLIVVDDFEQCASAKKVFKEGIDRQLLDQSSIHQLGWLLFSNDKNKPFHGKIMVNPIGMGVEDVLLAKAVYEKLKDGEDIRLF